MKQKWRDWQASPFYLLIRPYFGLLLLCAVLIAVVSGIGLAGPQLAGALVDSAAINKDVTELTDNLARLVGLFVLLGFATYAHVRLIRSVGAKLLCDLRERVFGRLIALSPGNVESGSTGEYVSRLNADVAKIQHVLTERFPQGFQSCLTFIGTLGMLFFLHTQLTVFSLILTPVIAMAAAWSGRHLESLATESLNALAVANARAQEAIGGIRTVQAFGQEARERARYGEAIRAVLKREYRIGHYAGAFSGLMQFVGFGAFALVLGYGSRLIAAGELTPGELTAFLLYMLSLTVAIVEVGDLFIAYKELRGASHSVLRPFTLIDAISDQMDARELLRPQGHIEFSQVGFSYPTSDGRQSQAVLSDINLSIRAGETIAVVGPNGAGKSTLFGLLLRYYDPTSGRIFIDGQDIRSLRLGSLRKAFAIVPQQVFLFSGCIADNLRYGNPNATDAQLAEAARLADMHGFVSRFPQGYETSVGELGQRLSGGQRQRLAIARAFLRDAPILLLDEVTNSLDPNAEMEIQEAITRLSAGRTTLMIAHHLASAQRADRVMFLCDGRVVACDTHATLYATNLRYRAHWEREPGEVERDSVEGEVMTTDSLLAASA